MKKETFWCTIMLQILLSRFIQEIGLEEDPGKIHCNETNEA